MTVVAGTPGGTGLGADPGSNGDVAEIARAGEPDRHLAALLAPEPERAALLALAALAAELAQIPHRAVREPFMGEIRLQWWREALELPPGESAGHRVADAVRQAARTCRLPAALLDGMIEARARELLAAPFDDEAQLRGFLWRTEGALFALACHVMDRSRPEDAGGSERQGAGDEVAAASAAAGRAYGLARLLLGLPRSLALGRVPLARDRLAQAGLTVPELLAGASGEKVEALMQDCHAQILGNLAEARRLALRLPRRQRVAFLPLALVASYVRVLQRQLRRGGGALREEASILPLTRVTRVAAAHVLGRW